MKKVYIEAYGCSANISDYEIASGLLKQGGFGFIDDIQQSDLNIIFTCVVKQQTFNRMIHRIKELTKLDKPLIVAGCMPKTDSKLIEKINSKASLLAPDCIEKIVEVARLALNGKKVVLLMDLRKSKLNMPRCRKNPIIGIVQIARGCLSNCAFCYEPYRSKLFSYPLNAILKEVKRDIADNCKEIWLTSLDNGCYGFDIGTNLANLLNEICNLEGKFFIRVGMMNPLHVKNILDELVEVYQNEKIFKFTHIPLQSGSDKILESMRRGYKAKDFIRIVKKFRKNFPSLTISTDIIVGFPGESEKDFKLTIELLERTRPDIVNISKFGARLRTEAEKMEQLDRKIINERSSFLSSLVKKISLENNKKWIGWKGEILIDEKGKNDTFIGRNFAYKPVVVKEKNLLGKFVDVEIFEASSNCLFGQ